MRSVPASPHFVDQDLWIEAQKLRHLGAVFSEEDQFVPLPVLPGRAVNTDVAGHLAGRPTVLAAHVE